MIQLYENALARIAVDTKAGSKSVAEYIPRADFLARIRDLIKNIGFKCGEERLSTTQDGTAFTGAVEVKNAFAPRLTRHYRAFLGFTFSHNNRRPCNLYGGIEGLEKAGGTFVFSRYYLNRRLARGPLFAAAEDHISKWLGRDLETYQDILDAMDRCWLTRAQGDALVMETLRKHYIVSSRLVKLEMLRDDVNGETSKELLIKMDKVVGYHPPISSCPISDQLKRMYGCFKVVTGAK